MKTVPSCFAAAALQLCLLGAPTRAQMPTKNPPPTSEKTNVRLEIEFAQAPLLEIELTKYLTSDVHKTRTFELPAILAEPLRTESGLVILPAQTKLRLKALVRPGTYFGHPGEVVLWLDPFPIGKGIEGFACPEKPEDKPEAAAIEQTATATAGRLHPQLCQQTWRLAFDHLLDYAATPEAARPLILERKHHHEGLNGTRASRPPNLFYDPASGNVDQRLQTAANRFQAVGLIYELSAAFTGAVRFLFSKRNVFLPSGTRIVFQLEQKLRLVPATDAPVRVLPFNGSTRNQASGLDSTEQQQRMK